MEGYYSFGQPRSWEKGYNFYDASGRKFAQIDINAPDFTKQIGYKFMVDKTGNGTLQEAATFYFNSEEQTINEKKDISHWVGELWVHAKGDTQQEKMKNLEYVNSVMKLLPDKVPEDSDGWMWNVNEYLHHLMIFLDKDSNGLAKPARLADEASIASTFDYQQALNQLVYRK